MAVTSIPLVGWSICWEDTTPENEEYTITDEGYLHTHAALIFKERLNIRGAGKFDVFTFDENGYMTDVIHPHALHTQGKTRVPN